MIREMTLGQYYKADSILHKLDPRVKLLGTLLFVITLFFPKSLLSLGIATAFLILIVKLSKVPVSMMIRGVKPLFIIICFSAIINMISVTSSIWRYACKNWADNNRETGIMDGILSCCTVGLSGHRFIRNDIYDNAKSTYRWT